MSFTEVRKDNINPLTLHTKEVFYRDLSTIRYSWTDRADVCSIANTFILESAQLITNSIWLFEQGYFDCAYYSLRQSLEISTTIIYLTEGDNYEKVLNDWKGKERFPMYSQMRKLLLEKKSVFSDMYIKMKDYFDSLDVVKNSMNKIVHKQGFDTFYVSRNHVMNQHKDHSKFIEDFNYNVSVCIGAVAVLRLAIDPFPILLGDEEIYFRTKDSMTLPYGGDFISKYIGDKYIELYKETDIYREVYDYFIVKPKYLPSVADVIKDMCIDVNSIKEILSQKEFLDNDGLIATLLIDFSDKITTVYPASSLLWYNTNRENLRKKYSWSSGDFQEFKKNPEKFNIPYDEVFISKIIVNGMVYLIQHNYVFSADEMNDIVLYESKLVEELHIRI